MQATAEASIKVDRVLGTVLGTFTSWVPKEVFNYFPYVIFIVFLVFILWFSKKSL